ncbi:MAG: DNA-formamidopyrimidine glycosylase family protein [Rhodothermales bacterium]|nr:DNA-formamidopyrimidine glycosylase family protein [Rhodothermales bacterium]
MPEGPEVRRSADQLHAALAGKPIAALAARTKAAKAWLAEHPDAFPGRRVERVVAHGKHLVGYVEGALYFHSHFMMWGRWAVVPPGDPLAATRDRRERARVAVEDAVAVLLSAPVFAVGRGDPYADDDRLAALGPDILPYDGVFDADAFRARLLAPEQRTRTIGAALLDQTVCAGIGNYLRAEVLYETRIDPWRRGEALTPAELDALAHAIPMLAARAYRHRRTVPAAIQQRLAEDPALVYQPGRDYGTRHYVFRRTNLPCLRCGDVVRQLNQVTRRIGDEEKRRIIYFCPTCQGTSVEVKPPKPRPAHA